MMVKVVGADLSKYHPRKCVAVLQQFNGLLNRHHTADSYNYNVEGKNLIIVFWPENTTTDSIQHYLDFGFDRLDFMYRNLEKRGLMTRYSNRSSRRIKMLLGKGKRNIV